MKSKLETRSKVRILEQCVVPSFTYGAQTWATTKTQRESLRITHTRMLRSIIEVKISDKIKLENIYGESGAREIGWVVKKIKTQVHMWDIWPGKKKNGTERQRSGRRGTWKGNGAAAPHPMEGRAD